MLTRRALLVSASACALAAPGWARIGAEAGRIKVRPVPLPSVRLKPSIYADAVETNRRTLLALSPDRLLHNFHASAGLPPKAERYGGWEARGHRRPYARPLSDRLLADVRADRRRAMRDRVRAHRRRACPHPGGAWRRLCRRHHGRARRQGRRRQDRVRGDPQAAISAPAASTSMAAGCRSIPGTRSMPG